MKRARVLFGLLGFATLALSALLIITWEVPASKEDVIGIYDLAPSDGKETLEIAEDHTYLHIHQPGHGKGFRNRGTWKWYSVPGDSRVRFSSFTFGPRVARKNSDT